MSSLAGILLILGALMALVGGSLPLASPMAKHFFWAPIDKQLASIAGNLRLWQWLNILFMLGSLLTVFGALLLTILLQAAGDRMLSQLGLLSLLFGTAFCVVDLAYRRSVGSLDCTHLWHRRTGGVSHHPRLSTGDPCYHHVPDRPALWSALMKTSRKTGVW
jgi:hypothetical protein